MKNRFRISEKALEDLENIWLYTLENWSAEQADRYYNLIMAECEYICDHFESGKSYDFIKKGYKAAIVKSHLIFYRRAEDGVLEIIRILHQRMNVENRLK